MTAQPKPKKLKERLEGRLITLERHRMKNAPVYYRALQDRNITRYLGDYPPPASLEEEKKFIRSSQRAWRKGEKAAYTILLNETGEVVGSIGLNNINWRSRNAKIGTFVMPEYWGRGINTEAKHLLINYAFNQLGLQRLELHIAEKNIRSYKATEKLGAVLEGVLRRNAKLRGRYHNMRVYGILREEWRERQRQR
ncbi:GNAT family N-acetyltransferase [Thermoproteota archaeon]